MYVLGAVYMVIMLGSAQVIRKPHPQVPAADLAKSVSLTGKAMKANEAVKTRSFRYLWLMFLSTSPVALA